MRTVPDVASIEEALNQMARMGVKIVCLDTTQVEFSLPDATPEQQAFITCWAKPIGALAQRRVTPMAGLTSPPVPPAWSAGVEPRVFLGRCYWTAFTYIQTHALPGIRLVHGHVSPPGYGVSLEHAWVQLPGGEIVFDGVIQRFFVWTDFQHHLGAEIVSSYSRDEALAHHATYGTYRTGWPS